MLRSLLVRGLVAGLVAGLLAGGVATIAAEPRIDRAIAFEAAHAHVHDDAPISRSGQKAGLFLATGIAGVSLGWIFALVYAAVLGRLGPRDPRRLGWALGVAGFVVVALAPALKYPPNPPSVGAAATITPRTLEYVTMLTCSLLGALAAARVLRSGMRARRLLAAGAFAVSVALACVLLPGVDEVPAGFPGDLLWEFRAASLSTQLAYWLALGGLFGALAVPSMGARA